MSKPSRDRLLDLLDVNTTTGEIYWRVSRGRARKGVPAGRITVHGYREICLDQQFLMAHAIVWFIATGEWTPLIDHRNGARAQNGFANLRAADAATNARNRTNYVHRKLLGAYPGPDGRYRAAITADGQAFHLGVFATEAEAHQRYLAARTGCAAAELVARQAFLKGLSA